MYDESMGRRGSKEAYHWKKNERVLIDECDIISFRERAIETQH